jgi:WD40 repeat protein
MLQRDCCQKITVFEPNFSYRKFYSGKGLTMKIAKRFVICLVLIVGAVGLSQAQGDAPATSGQLEAITVDNVGQLEAILIGDFETKHVSFSPDGTMIAVAYQQWDFDYNITIYDFQTGEEVSYMQGRMDFVHDLIWSPDNKRIAVISGRTTGGGIDIRSVKTYTLEKGANAGFYLLGNSDVWYSDDISSTADAGYPIQVAWHPTAYIIAVAFYERLEIYDVEADEMLFSEPVSDIKSVEWAANGKVIITESGEGQVLLWGVPAMEE